MTRHALIIAVPGVKGEKGYLAGTEIDEICYRNFLYSKVGGDWYESEIQTLINPTIAQIKSKISEARNKNYDYSITAFSGHGCVNGITNLMYINVKDGNLPETELYVNSKWETIIIDACRVVTYSQVGTALLNKSIEEGLLAGIPNARKLYEDYITRCDEGRIIVYSCKINQAAQDDAKKGGAFLSSLIKAGINYGKTNGNHQVQDILDAFNEGKEIMKVYFPKTSQDADVQSKTKRKFWFPFALRPSKNLYD